MNKFIIGIDLGATFVKMGLLSSDGKLIGRFFLPTQNYKDKFRLLKTIVNITYNICQQKGIRKKDVLGIGMGLPGPVDTPIHLSWAGDDVAGAYERMRKELPLGRMGTADELANWIVWLASPSASWVTGTVIPVDGGQVLPGALSRI